MLIQPQAHFSLVVIYEVYISRYAFFSPDGSSLSMRENLIELWSTHSDLQK